MTTLTYAERIAVWRQGNPHERLTFDLLLEICDATSLTNVNLRDANLRDANLRDADLLGADLRKANLWRADLSGADLRGAYLTGANLRGANLLGANLGKANLWRADLRGAYLRGAYLTGANLGGVDWDGLQITGLPSGQIVLIPTPDGWELRVGCWAGTIDGLRTLIAQDDGWPEAEGDEITRRRPGLQAALALIDAHIALHPNVINQLKTKWGER
jgi:hypothetical protein